MTLEDHENMNGDFTEAYTKTMLNSNSKARSRKSKKSQAQQQSPAKKKQRPNVLKSNKKQMSESLKAVLHDTQFKNHERIDHFSAVKGIWEHIRNNNLQQTKNGKKTVNVKMDRVLKELCGNPENDDDVIHQLEIAKHISRHLSNVD